MVGETTRVPNDKRIHRTENEKRAEYIIDVSVEDGNMHSLRKTLRYLEDKGAVQSSSHVKPGSLHGEYVLNDLAITYVPLGRCFRLSVAPSNGNYEQRRLDAKSLSHDLEDHIREYLPKKSL